MSRLGYVATTLFTVPATGSVFPFEPPSGFSPDPLTLVIQARARGLPPWPFRPGCQGLVTNTRIFWTRRIVGPWCATRPIPGKFASQGGILWDTVVYFPVFVMEIITYRKNGSP